jgi:hypothetical protein
LRKRRYVRRTEVRELKHEPMRRSVHRPRCLRCAHRNTPQPRSTRPTRQYYADVRALSRLGREHRKRQGFAGGL